MDHFTSFIPRQLHIYQLNGSTVPALGCGLKLIQCPTIKNIIPLWPTYYMPDNPQCTLSLTVLCHYLHFNVLTKHLHSLQITTTSGYTLACPSLASYSTKQLLDYHHFTIVRPTRKVKQIISPTVKSATSEAPLNHLLAHQHLGHGCDEILDTMCR